MLHSTDFLDPNKFTKNEEYMLRVLVEKSDFPEEKKKLLIEKVKNNTI
jgi:hypothetical protein